MGHRPITRRHVGELLHDDFEPFTSTLPARLLSVYTDTDSATLIVNTDGGGLHFRADPDDTLYWGDGPIEESDVDLSEQEPWRSLIGLECDFAWSTINQQGYMDGALLSFGGMLPRIALNVIASTIKVSSCGPWNSLNNA
jgi:hypothetical protein